VLVLEVKDWHVDHIHSMDRAQAVLTTERGLVRTLNPFEQARQLAENVADCLQGDPALVRPERDRHSGKLCFPWSYGVVLPFMTRLQFENAQLGEVLPAERVICADEMTFTVAAAAFRDRLWRMLPWQTSEPLSAAQIARVRWHLFPEIRITPPQQIMLLEETVPDIVRVMDIEQERLARSLGEGHRVIHGVAGSGKTMILVYRCVHLAKLMSKPILVLCYNRTLADRLAAMIKARGITHRVHVRSFHAWCRDQLIHFRCELPIANDGNEYARRLVVELGRSIDAGRVPRHQYGAVLIDEGHDFEPEWLQIAVEMVALETSSLLLLYDDAQSIYRRRKFSLLSVGIHASGRTTVLRLNYRNTAEILNVAYKFAENVLTPDDAGEEGIPLLRPKAADHHGPAPGLMRLPSLGHEAERIARTFAQLRAEGFSWSDMAVLYRSTFIEKEIVETLERAGIPAAPLTKRSGEMPLPVDRVSLVTFHSSKGLEYPIVAIPGLGFLPHPHETEADEARLAYVAMTRATQRLFLSCHRDSPFVRRLLAIGVPYLPRA
jgi:superfamily I DNA/RNA helicase